MTRCLSFEQLVALHFELVCNRMGERFLGVLDEGLLKAALARPRNAEAYEGADVIRQAAYLFHGLLMNHGFVQGNKRTAYLALEWFLHANDAGRIQAPDNAVIEMCLTAIQERWDPDQVDKWLRRHIVAP